MSLRDQLQTDLDEVVFNPDDFAQAGTITHAGGTAYEVLGIFSAPYQEVDLDSHQAVQSVHPTFMVRTQSLTAVPKRDDKVVIGGVEYKVRESQPDGFAVTTLILWRK